ncbi:MAG TPA: aldehyde ferredoxin oxidoreductase C-terminal domain-containing protein [Acidobacteriota bacterium]|nr:aldehyde ferredoxin oxidoreductase C-terminal domain-containing protein [Acidobacteriota bacterium]
MNNTKIHTDVDALKARHVLLKEFRYELRPVVRGYNMRTLYVNVSSNEIREKPVSEEMKQKFTGGKGFGLKLLWDAISDTTRWNDPENEINISMGPICGNTNYPGSGKSLVVSISPLTDIPIDSNVGGYFGPYLKFSGFDALEIQGKAERDVIVYIDGNQGLIQIFEAPAEAVDSHILAEQMVELFADNELEKMHISAVSAGRGAEHALIGCLNFSFYDRRRKVARLKQAGRGGIGTVLRDKKIKAVVVKYSGLSGKSNDPADLDTLQRTGLKLHKEIIALDDQQCRMRQIGTAHLVEIMDEYDLLPTHNFKFGRHADTPKINSHAFYEFVTHGLPDGCWFGCTMACAKAADGFELLTGPYKGHRVTVDGPEYETVGGCGSNVGIFDPRAIMEINFYCDTYGLDTISFGTMTAFIMECWEKGVLNAERTGGLDFTWGNWQDALEMMHQIARGEGFGLIAGLGTRKMKEYFIDHFDADPQLMQDIGCECKGLEYSQYVSKESLAQQGGYSMALKGPQHDEAWLIFMDMVNNQIPTFTDKAEALHYFPMFRTWFGLQGLCKLPWNDVEPANNAQTDEPAKVPEHVQNYVDIYNAITGGNLDKKELILQSERVYNFQKVLCMRLGRGRRSDDIPPFRMVGPVTIEEYESRQDRYDQQLREKVGVDPAGKSSEEKLRILRHYREEQYQHLLDAVYKRKGWTPEGVPTPEHLRKIGMDLPEVLAVVERHLR